ncbi:MAG: pseudouridine-5'-phosphate glycosidase, partial [Nitriliruptorales bacterium]
STIFSRLGLPAPRNAEALERCAAAIREAGAVPALTAVLDGVAHVGVADGETDRVLAGETKVGVRDLPVALAEGWPVGVTTVSATVALAARVGVGVFATGGIGGVHADVAETGDVSSDLGAIARHPVVTVCAGAKAFLDVGRTLERLETLGVPVLVLGADEFPAFYSRRSGFPAPRRVDSVEEVAAVVRAARELGTGGVLLAVPIPQADELPRDALDAAIVEAEEAAATAGVRGADVTPFVLERIAAATGGRAVDANLALAEHNARIAAQLARALLRS